MAIDAAQSLKWPRPIKAKKGLAPRCHVNNAIRGAQGVPYREQVDVAKDTDKARYAARCDALTQLLAEIPNLWLQIQGVARLK